MASKDPKSPSSRMQETTPEKSWWCGPDKQVSNLTPSLGLSSTWVLLRSHNSKDSNGKVIFY